MKNYLFFLMKITRRKLGVYLVSIFAMALFGILMYFTISGNNTHESALTEVISFYKFIPFIFSALFSALVVAYIFKDGEKDGTELMVVAKPITRKEIIASKFLAVFLIIIFYQIVQGLGYLIISMTDSNSSMNQRIAWVGSLTIGGLIVQIIIVSFIIMLTTIFGKVGTIIFSILFASLTPIVSFILTPMSQGLTKINGLQKYTSIYFDDNDSSKSSENIYEFLDEKSDQEDFDHYKNHVWYGKVAPFDAWYQWSNFYSLFLTGDASTSMSATKWVDEEYVTSNNNDLDNQIKINDKYYMFLYNSNFVDGNNFKADKTTDEIIKAINFLNDAISNKAIIDDHGISLKDFDDFLKQLTNFPSLHERISFILNTFEQYFENNWFNNSIIKHINNNDSDYIIMTYQYLSKKYEFNTSSKYHSISDPLNNEDRAGRIYFQESGKPIKYKIIPKDFLNKNISLLIWIGIGVLFMSGAVIIYMKRDFK